MLVDLTPPIRSETIGGEPAEPTPFAPADDWLDPLQEDSAGTSSGSAEREQQPSGSVEDPLVQKHRSDNAGPDGAHQKASRPVSDGQGTIADARPGASGPMVEESQRWDRAIGAEDGVDRALLAELQTLRRHQADEAQARQELLLTFEARERELRARLDATQQDLDAGRAEVAYLRQRQEEQHLSRERLEEQHQLQLRDLQQALVGARLEISSGHADLEALRLRNAELQLLREQIERQSQQRINQLEQELASARQELSTGLADIEALRQRSNELQRQREQSEQQSQNHISHLEQELTSLRRMLEERNGQQEALETLRQERDALLNREQEWRQQLEAARGGSDPTLQSPAPPVQGGDLARQERAQLEEELMALHRLLEELPDIYEGKFQQRLQPLLEQRDWLLRENGWLRAVLQPAASEESPQEKQRLRLLPPLPSRPRLRQGLQALLQLARSAEATKVAVRDGTNPPPDDDGQPTDASAVPRHR